MKGFTRCCVYYVDPFVIYVLWKGSTKALYLYIPRHTMYFVKVSDIINQAFVCSRSEDRHQYPMKGTSKCHMSNFYVSLFIKNKPQDKLYMFVCWVNLKICLGQLYPTLKDYVASWKQINFDKTNICIKYLLNTHSQRLMWFSSVIR